MFLGRLNALVHQQLPAGKHRKRWVESFCNVTVTWPKEFWGWAPSWITLCPEPIWGRKPFNLIFFRLQHLLPMNIISSSGLSVVYNSANFVEGPNLNFAASFNFHNEETCGPRRVSSPLGRVHFSIFVNDMQRNTFWRAKNIPLEKLYARLRRLNLP